MFDNFGKCGPIFYRAAAYYYYYYYYYSNTLRMYVGFGTWNIRTFTTTPHTAMHGAAIRHDASSMADLS